MGGGETLQGAHDFVPVGVRVAERTAEKWRKAEAENGAEIAFGRRTEDCLLEAARRLVHEHEREALRDVLDDDAVRIAGDRAHARVRPAPLAVVQIEPATPLLPLETLGDQGVHQRGRANPARFRDSLPCVCRGLEADLIDEP